MAKVIEFYARDPFPKKGKSVPSDRRAKVIEFPKEKSAFGAKTNKSRELNEGGPVAASWPGCF